MSSNDIVERYWLNECVAWIRQNGFKRVAVQLKQDHLKHSVQITDFLKHNCYPKSESSSEAELDVYCSQPNTCCVDLLVTQHVSKLEAIVHIGQVCLSKSVIKSSSSSLPILFIFEKHSANEKEFSENVRLIYEHIESCVETEKNCRLCVLYDSNFVEYANAIEKLIVRDGLERSVHIADLHCSESHWQTVPTFEARLGRSPEGESSTFFGPYILRNRIDHYNCAVYIGDKLPISLAVECPPKLTKLNIGSEGLEIQDVNTTRLLNKRIALISRLKEEEELKIGVIITNPLPDLTSTMQKLKEFSTWRNHTLYFISMIQTIDECKVGNFDLCDAFVVSNSCTCSSILESLVFNRPILSELEFKLACGIEAEYGRVTWPGSSSHLPDDDMINKRKASDVSLALVQTRNELLERCSQARLNKWSGMDYEKTDGEMVESLDIGEGLKGIASSYYSEPLRKMNQGKSCGGKSEGSVGSGASTSTSLVEGMLSMKINDYDDTGNS